MIIGSIGLYDFNGDEIIMLYYDGTRIFYSGKLIT